MKSIFSSAHIEPTDMCNLRCYSCRRSLWVQRGGGRSVMAPATFKKVMEKLKNEEVEKLWLYWRGEPCLSPYLPELAKIAKQQDPDIYTFTSTNMAVPSLHNIKYVSKLLGNLNAIEFCVDGYNQQSLSKYRAGAKWQMTLKNLETISKIKTKCLKMMRVLMFRWNENHEKKFRDFARKYNMDILFFGLPVINDKTVLTLKEAEHWLPKNPKYWRYRRKAGVFFHPSRPVCTLHSIITATGEVAYCGVDMPMRYGSAGNILKEPLKVIKERYWKLASKMYFRQLDICKKHCCCVPKYPVNRPAELFTKKGLKVFPKVGVRRYEV